MGMLAPLQILVTAPDVVDQNVQASLLGADPLEDRPRLLVFGVVAGDRDCVAVELRGFLCGLFDRVETLAGLSNVRSFVDRNARSSSNR
jgi:hypothetical protein